METLRATATFGKRIFDLRKGRQWSQPRLGKVIGTSGAIIGRYERDEMTPSIEVVRKLSDAFEVTLNYLVSESDTCLKDKAMLNRLQKLGTLPSDDRDRIIDVVDLLIRDSKARQTHGW